MASVPRNLPGARRPNLAVRITQRVLVAIVVIVAFLALMLAIFVRPDSRGADSIFGHPLFSVVSGSMTPAIDTGDLIIDNPVTPTQAANLRAGQIISFEAAQQGSSSIIITHRIVAVVGSGSTLQYRTKGDANNAPDQTLVTPSQVVGVFSSRVPFGGYILSTLHQPLTFVILIMIPVAYIAVGEIRRRWVLYGEQDRRTVEARRKQAADASAQGGAALTPPARGRPTHEGGGADRDRLV